MRNPILFLALVAIAIPAIAQQTAKYHRVAIYLDTPNHLMPQLAQLGLETDHGFFDGSSITSDFSEEEIADAEEAGFRTQVIINDVSEYYARLNDDQGRVAMKGTGEGKPVNFALGSYNGYYSYQEMLQLLDDMAARYPHLISKKAQIDSFRSIKGEPLYWVRISNQPAIEQKEKPQVLYTALHHAREPGSLSQMIYFMWHVLEQYAHDDKIKAIVDNTELYFIPCVNPDGYQYNIDGYPKGGGMWRKNLRAENNGFIYGVDLNRNYGYGWGSNDIGSSSRKDAQTYRGTNAFSEPETKAVKWFTETHHFGIALNYHTSGNLLLYPWGNYHSGYPNGVSKTPDSLLYYAYADILTRDNGYKSGVCYEMLDYYTNGDAADWMYGEERTKDRIISFIPEVGGAFYVPMSEIENDCSENVTANINAAALLLPFPDIIAAAVEYNNLAGNISYTIRALGLKEGKYSVSLHAVDQWLQPLNDYNVFNGLRILEIKESKLGFVLNNDIKEGQEVKYILRVDNGLYADTFPGSFRYSKDSEHRHVRAYPNPAKDYMNVFIDDALQVNDAECILFDIQGRVQMKFYATSGVKKIDISSLHHGLYILKIITKEYGISNIKLSIER